MDNLFESEGAHVLVDGQFGSTGKGALAAWLAHQALEQDWTPGAVVSNAGPNSGHTFYHGDDKIVLKQLPTFAVASYLLGKVIPVYLSAGAIVDPAILRKEAEAYPLMPIWVHPNATVITEADKETEHSGTVAAVAGTRSGTGAALARKVLRDPHAVWGGSDAVTFMPPNVNSLSMALPRRVPYFVEVSQGFSLGINQRFYPKCTSRECTVMQAMADAGLGPRNYAKSYMSIRTYPIRVGNVDGHSSGDWYPDQHETSWEALGVEAERTTVTNRVRRVATFSYLQYVEALQTNEPDFVFVNFLNYLREEEQGPFVEMLRGATNGSGWPKMIGGFGPKVENVRWLEPL